MDIFTKTSGRSREESTSYPSITFFFRLFQHFAEVGNQQARQIYTSLVDALIANHANEDMRAFFFLNFLDIFEENDRIPVTILLKQLLPCIKSKTDNNEEPQSYFLNSLDFEFLNAISKHPQLGKQ